MLCPLKGANDELAVSCQLEAFVCLSKRIQFQLLPCVGIKYVCVSVCLCVCVGGPYYYYVGTLRQPKHVRGDGVT